MTTATLPTVTVIYPNANRSLARAIARKQAARKVSSDLSVLVKFSAIVWVGIVTTIVSACA